MPLLAASAASSLVADKAGPVDWAVEGSIGTEVLGWSVPITGSSRCGSVSLAISRFDFF